MNRASALPAWSRTLTRVAAIMAMVAIGAWSSTQVRAEEAGTSIALGSGRPQLIEFGMGVCQICQRMRPVMDRAQRELGDRVDVRVLDIRVEANDELARRFGMEVIPLVVLADGSGQELWRHEGFIDYEPLARAVTERVGATTEKHR